jgi:hypothetical protein
MAVFYVGMSQGKFILRETEPGIRLYFTGPDADMFVQENPPLHGKDVGFALTVEYLCKICVIRVKDAATLKPHLKNMKVEVPKCCNKSSYIICKHITIAKKPVAYVEKATEEKPGWTTNTFHELKGQFVKGAWWWRWLPSTCRSSDLASQARSGTFRI